MYGEETLIDRVSDKIVGFYFTKIKGFHEQDFQEITTGDIKSRGPRLNYCCSKCGYLLFSNTASGLENLSNNERYHPTPQVERCLEHKIQKSY